MADSKVSVLNSLLGSALASGDLFYVVDVSAGTAGSKKITRDELIIGLGIDQVNAAVQTALDGKVDENSAIVGATKTKITYDAKGLVTSGADATTADIAPSTDRNYVTDAQLVVIGNTSGTNTGDNAVNTLYSGLAASKQDTLISATNIKTVNSTSLLGSGDLAVQAVLVSGTNIKTINGTSLLGSGDITISGGGGTPSGAAGSVQFSDGSGFASDNTNIFWDDTNNRFGLGVNSSLLSRLHVVGTGTGSGSKSVVVQDSGKTNQHFFIQDDGDFGNINSTANALQINFSPVANKWLKLTRQSQEVIIGAGNTGNSSIGTSTSISFSFLTNNQLRATIAATGEMLIGSGTSVDAGAQLEIKSTTKGVKFPNTVTASMVSPSAGVVFWDTALLKLRVYNGSAWETITSS